MCCKFYHQLYLLTLTAAICFVGSSGEADAQALNEELQFPYQAIVSTEQALVHSGPGKVHYATNELDQGSTVEVYRHDPGGWCAIRPIGESFSLIPATAVEILEDGVGRIKEQGTQAWVGTQLGPVDKPLWQIKLKQHELVEILGQANWPDPAGHSTTWYQIAPPAGEFRWIHSSDIQPPPSLENLIAAANESPDTSIARSRTENSIDRGFEGRLNVAETNPVEEVRFTGQLNAGVQLTNYQSDTGDQNLERPPRQQPATMNAINHGWRKAKITRSDVSPGSQFDNTNVSGHALSQGLNSTNWDADAPNVPRSSIINQAVPPRFASSRVDAAFDLQQLDLSQQRYDRVDAGGFASPSDSGFSSNQPLTARLAGLEMELNLEMIKQPTQWELVALRAKVDSIYEGTKDPLERLQAERMLSKLDNCRKIKSGYLGVSPLNSLPSSGVVGSGVATAEELGLGTTYDAYGWLNELVRESGSMQSTFVLQDENGKITHHVSPTPGFNLRPYLKSKVGIIGQRGYHTELNLNHVTAERVVELKRR